MLVFILFEKTEMFWSVVVALGVFLGGLEVARRSEWAVEDPLEGVSGRTAGTL